MIRALIAVIFVVIYCIISIPLLLIMTLVRKFNPVTAEMFMLRVVQGAFRIILFICGTKITVLGRENIPEDEAVLFVGNHQSLFDIVTSYCHMKNRCGYIAKDNLAHIPLLSWNMRFLLCLFLDRNDLKKGLETIKQAIEYIKQGISVFIFPEGTRNKSGDETALNEFHRGSFKMAQRTGCSIVPVSFNNTASIFEAQFPRVKPAHIIIEYGKPVPYGSLTREEQKNIDEHFRKIIAEMVTKNRELI